MSNREIKELREYLKRVREGKLKNHKPGDNISLCPVCLREYVDDGDPQWMRCQRCRPIGWKKKKYAYCMGGCGKWIVLPQNTYMPDMKGAWCECCGERGGFGK